MGQVVEIYLKIFQLWPFTPFYCTFHVKSNTIFPHSQGNDAFHALTASLVGASSFAKNALQRALSQSCWIFSASLLNKKINKLRGGSNGVGGRGSRVQLKHVIPAKNEHGMHCCMTADLSEMPRRPFAKCIGRNADGWPKRFQRSTAALRWCIAL